MVNKKINVLVLGGSGFLGSHVADELSKRKYNVIIYDKVPSRWANKNQKIIIGDLSNYNKINKIIKKTQIVYNFAGISSIKQNILANAEILELCIKNKVERFVYASSIYVYSEKGSFYKCSKQAAESYIQEYSNIMNLNYTILRFGSLYGPRSNYSNGLYKIIHDFFRFNKLSYFGTKKTLRKYIYVKDAAQVCVDILKNKYKNSIIEISGRKKISLFKVLKLLSKIFNYKDKLFFENLDNPNHYEKTPYTFKIKHGIKCYSKNNTEFSAAIQELAKEIKSDIK
jgi:UDP-glucose 4-epimerase